MSANRDGLGFRDKLALPNPSSPNCYEDRSMNLPTYSRRHVLRTASSGFGYLALAGLCAEQARGAAPSADALASGPAAMSSNPLSPKTPHFAPKAKRVIFMFNQGGPSHVDSLDYKPQLAKDDGKSPSQTGQYKAGSRKLMKSPFKFSQHGQSGLWLSELMPNLAKHADDMCLLNGMHTDVPLHPEASVQMHTGSFQFVRPSMGAWLLYGLGTENAELPGFITVKPLSRVGGAQNYGSAFLPAPYQGTRIGADGQTLANATIPHIRNPRMNAEAQRKQLDLLQQVNRDRLGLDGVNTELEGVIESYELAFRMQGAVPRMMDLSDESQATLDAYGINGRTSDFGYQCLLARRFAEAGVRFIEVSTGGWDQHGSLQSGLMRNWGGIDQPIAALISDLRQRGLLDDTLIVWGGEFGRTPHAQKPDGRDHNSTGFSMFMVGGGVKGGIRYGATDEHGIAAVENKMHVHDLHATILHLMGLDHTKLTYRYSGRDFRLTDVYGRVAHEIIA